MFFLPWFCSTICTRAPWNNLWLVVGTGQAAAGPSAATFVCSVGFGGFIVFRFHVPVCRQFPQPSPRHVSGWQRGPVLPHARQLVSLFWCFGLLCFFFFPHPGPPPGTPSPGWGWGMDRAEAAAPGASSGLCGVGFSYWVRGGRTGLCAHKGARVLEVKVVPPHRHITRPRSLPFRPVLVDTVSWFKLSR